MSEVEFAGMPGIKPGKRLKGVMAKTVTGFMRALQDHRVCADAGDHGCVTVYIDDVGDYRCIFQRHHFIENEQSCKTKTMVRKWLVEWMPKQKSPAHE